MGMLESRKLDLEGLRNAGDPGPVLARRLSNAEYDYTIRDLTGVDLRPAHEFPVDPANQAWLDALTNFIVNSSKEDTGYYDSTIKLLSLIALSGNWWSP